MGIKRKVNKWMNKEINGEKKLKNNGRRGRGMG
jgi:hypothetical protein